MKTKKRMLYAITDRRLYGTSEAQSRAKLIEQTAVWAANGVAYIQLREKDMTARDQVGLARAMLEAIRNSSKQGGEHASARLLINGRSDVALAAGADGVHLPATADTLTPDEVRRIFSAAGRKHSPCVSISSHTLRQVEVARQQKPDCILFAPVFEKQIEATANPKIQHAQPLPGSGLKLLEQACQTAAPVPVFALGGVTAANALQCLRTGASGVAAIRWLQEPPSTWLQFA